MCGLRLSWRWLASSRSVQSCNLRLPICCSPSSPSGLCNLPSQCMVSMLSSLHCSACVLHSGATASFQEDCNSWLCWAGLLSKTVKIRHCFMPHAWHKALGVTQQTLLACKAFNVQIRSVAVWRHFAFEQSAHACQLHNGDGGYEAAEALLTFIQFMLSVISTSLLQDAYMDSACRCRKKTGKSCH